MADQPSVRQMTHEERVDVFLRAMADDLTWMAKVIRSGAAWPSPAEQVETLSRGALERLAHLARELGRPVPVSMYAPREAT